KPYNLKRSSMSSWIWSVDIRDSMLTDVWEFVALMILERLFSPVGTITFTKTFLASLSFLWALYHSKISCDVCRPLTTSGFLIFILCPLTGQSSARIVMPLFSHQKSSWDAEDISSKVFRICLLTGFDFPL